VNDPRYDDDVSRDAVPGDDVRSDDVHYDDVDYGDPSGDGVRNAGARYDENEHPADAAGEPFPWPPPEGESIVSAFGRTWQGASLQPRRFFHAMPEHGSIRSALLYYIPIGIAVAGANLFWTQLRGGIDAEQDAVLGEMPLGGAMNPLLEFFFAPVILVVSLLLSAAITHGLLKLFGGPNRGFRFTTRIFAFAYSPQILGVIPVAGTVIGFVWMVGVAVIGLREGHGTTTARAAAAVLIPVAVALIFVALAAFLATTGRILLN
jgi:hypothetical protein